MIGYGNSMFLSTILDTEMGAGPVNTVAPVISGLTTFGATLTSNTGTWTGTPVISYSYQWKRNGSDITSATNSTYVLTLADSGANITCQVTATNAFGSASATSNTITAGTYAAPVNTVAPVISGNTTLNSLLSCTTGTWTGTPTITYVYQWKRNGNNIVGATSNLYTLQVADSGAAITCQVTATNPIGSTAAGSNTITAGTYTAPVNTVAPVISGTQVVGSALSSTTGTWTGTAIITFTYQWYRGASLISGATSSSYTLVQADAGNTSNITCQVTGTNAIGNATATSNTLAQIFDFDADAFITSASLTDSTQKGAVNTLTIDLKGYSIWSKMKAIYPFVGGTATTHKWNLKDPRDLDAAFRLVFSGGWTHSSTGALPNGTNAYADSKLKLQTNISATNHSFGIYSRTNDTTGSKLWGGFDSALSLFAHNNLTAANLIDGTASTSISYTANPSTKLILATRRSSTDFQGYRDGISLGTNTTSTTAVFNGNMYFGARNNTAGTDFWSNHQLAFGIFSEGLTNTEVTNLNTAVVAFETALSRNV